MKQVIGIVGAVIIAFLVLTGVFGSWYTVDEGERGVLLRNGKFVEVVQPGLGFKWPMIESVETISVRDFTMSYKTLEAYSKDQQPATISASVTFHIPEDKVVELYTRFGSIENLISRIVSTNLPTQMENIFGTYTAERVIANRNEFVSKVNSALKEITNNGNYPIFVSSVQVENIKFEPEYEQAIMAKMQAEVDAAREESIALKTVTAAQAAADSVEAQSIKKAEAIEREGAAEAAAIRAKGDALRANKDLVELTYAERWNGAMPSQLTVLPDTTVPMFNANK